MNVRAALVGDPRVRSRVTGLAVSIPVLASVAFLLEFDVVLTAWLLFVSLAVALYAGLVRAGILAGWGAVFLTVLWRFVFPPFIGYLRWSWDLRYTPPRILTYKLGPRGELLEGLTNGPVYAFLGAVVLGGAAYLVGAVVRRLLERRMDGS